MATELQKVATRLWGPEGPGKVWLDRLVRTVDNAHPFFIAHLRISLTHRGRRITRPHLGLGGRAERRESRALG